MNIKIKGFTSHNELQKSISETVLIEILKFQFIEKYSEMTFDELNNYIDTCLCLGISENLSVKAKVEMYSCFINSGEPIPLDNEAYNLLLKELKNKDRENFIYDWKQFIDDYLTDYLRENENLNTKIEIRNRINKLKKDQEKWFVNLIKEARKEQEKWEEEILAKRKKAISYYQKERIELFGKRTEKVKNEILPFDIFPKGELTTKEIVKKLRNNGIKVSSEGEFRLERIEEEFDYNIVCTGKGDFKNYVVYRFEDTDVIIAEKPAYGNATYLIKGNWEKEVIKILQISRNEARNSYPNKVKRVIHNDEKQWLSNLQFEFNLWF